MRCRSDRVGIVQESVEQCLRRRQGVLSPLLLLLQSEVVLAERQLHVRRRYHVGGELPVLHAIDNHERRAPLLGFESRSIDR